MKEREALFAQFKINNYIFVQLELTKGKHEEKQYVTFYNNIFTWMDIHRTMNKYSRV